MSRKQKLLEKLYRMPSDFSWRDAETLLAHFGFDYKKKGKTSGSRRAFYNADSDLLILLHEPHDPPNLRNYQMKQLIEKIEEHIQWEKDKQS